MTDDAPDLGRKKRQLITGIIAVVLLIGVGGVAIALGSTTDSSETTTGDSSSGVDGGCRSDRVVAYRVAPDPKTAAASGAAEAAKPWQRKGESAQVTAIDATSSQVALATSDGPRREVLTVQKGGSGWSVTGTAACLYEKKGATACPQGAELALAGQKYSERKAGTVQPTTVVVGQGTLEPCVKEQKKVFTAPGGVAPVTVFGSRSAGTVLVDLGGGTYAAYRAAN